MSLLDLIFLISAVVVGVISFTRDLSSFNPTELTPPKSSRQPQSSEADLPKRLVHEAHHTLTLNQ